MARESGRLHIHLWWLLLVFVAICLTWFSVRAIAPPAVETSTPDQETYVVEIGELSRSAGLSGSATWVRTTPGVAGSHGTITEINLDEEISAGTVVFSVDLVPTVAIEGSIPAFRDLESGMDGPDVAQIQSFLGTEVTGVFDTDTEARVVEWQEEVGWEADGVVRRGHVLVLPSLPTRAKIVDGIALGASVSPGQPIVTAYAAAPVITVPTDPSDPKAPSSGMSAKIEIAGEQFPGILAADDSLDGRTLHVVLDDGSSACIDTCADLVPHGDHVSVRVVVDLVPETTGPIVPISALQSQPDGTTVLEQTNGTALPVEIVLSDGGHAIVTDIDPGTEIFLFGSS